MECEEFILPDWSPSDDTARVFPSDDNDEHDNVDDDNDNDGTEGWW